MGGLTLALQENPAAVARTDLTLLLTEHSTGCHVSLEYNSDLFDAVTARRCLAQFKILLEVCASDPACRVSQIPLADINARDLVFAGQATFDTSWAWPTLDGLFMNSTVRNPGATAVVHDNRQITYGELEQLSRAVAQTLIRNGVNPGDLVAVVMDPGCEQVIATLAVLRAGAAYLPIDSRLPANRVRELISNGRARNVLTQSWVRPTIKWPQGLRVVEVDRHSPPNDVLGPVSRSASNLAYVIYTSGSTGKPKGVMIDHRGAVNTILDINERFAIKSEDRLLAVSSLAFDLSVYDIFGLLAAGGTIVIPSRGSERDPTHWHKLINDHRVTVWNSVPAMAEMLAATAAPEAPPMRQSLRLGLLSGDWISLGLPDRLWAAFPDMRLVSLGGATEASIWSVSYSIGKVEPEWRSIPYGRGLKNQSVYVLDPALEPCGIGMIGAIHIGGIGVAVGYWRDPRRTANRFIIHPRTNERLYRTGDLGRYLRDGNIEILGREDFQIKIRGFRIEPGEIEATLRKHSGVQDAIVSLYEHEAMDKQLVGHVMARPHSAVSAGDLRTFLGSRLPEYMIPAALVLLDAFPLTANNKIDRTALPVPAWGTSRPPSVTARQGSQMERAIAQIWTEVLGLAEPDLDVSFFELGGHSLLATRVWSRMKERFHVDVPLRVLYQRPTIAQLATAVEELARVEELAPAQPIEPVSRRGWFPLSHAQERMWFLYHADRSSREYTIPMAWRLIGNLNVLALADAFDKFVERHELLRTRFSSMQNEPAQRVMDSVPGVLALVTSNSGHGKPELALKSYMADVIDEGLDLENVGAFKARLFCLNDHDHLLMLASHHIAWDGWSSAIAAREISLLYQGRLSEREAKLPELRVQYGDYVHWERSAEHERKVADHVTYWKALFSQFPRPHRYDIRGEAHRIAQVRVSAAAIKAVNELAKEVATTPFIIYLTAFQIALARFWSVHDLVVGTAVDLRSQPDLEGIVGPFVNVLPVSVRLANTSTWRDAVRLVTDVFAEGYAHREAPFETVVREAGPLRRSFSSPLFDAWFNYEPEPAQALDLPGVHVKTIESGHRVQRAPIRLAIYKTPSGLKARLGWDRSVGTDSQLRHVLETIIEALPSDPDSTVTLLNVGSHLDGGHWNA